MLRIIDRIIVFFGHLAAACLALLMVVILLDVLLRTSLQLTAAWVVELEWHLFALSFLFGIPYALQQHKHVRVDLFYERFSEADRGKVNFFGAILFLLPWSVLVFITGSSFLRAAWIMGEGSPNPGGLPTFVPIKAAIPLMALLLFLQGIAAAIRAYYQWRRPEKEVR